MLKYRCKYRVVCEYDRRNLEPLKEDVYIYCSNGGQIYRIDENTLAYYRENGTTSKILFDKLDEAKVEYENRTNGELLFYFAEKDIDKVALIISARTRGASYPPWSKRNLKLFKWFNDNEKKYIEEGYYKVLTDEEKEEYKKRFNKAKEMEE